ncbi:hypothetical protein TWF718_007810 [Orbilia javanica]|uniref:Uncharacterized protein n=1 Tax=Orbilia javanica TaxID=47235 RepID=A0AAN8MRR5_9PEZI
MAFIQPQNKARSPKFTPSPPTCPTTPASQKPAYMAAHTPIPVRIRPASGSCTRVRHACALLNLNGSSGGKTTGRKRGRLDGQSTLGNVESLSPTQAAVEKRKRPRISQEGIANFRVDNGKRGTPFAVEIAAGCDIGDIGDEAISPLKLDNSDMGVFENMTEATEDIGETTTTVVKPCTPPPPRRRGRPPKKVTPQGGASKPIPTSGQMSPTQASKHNRQATSKDNLINKEPQENSRGSKPTTKTVLENAIDVKISSHAKPPYYSRSRLQELINKLDESADTGTEAKEISDTLADIIENSSTSDLAASMVHLEAPVKVRQKIFICIIVALLSSGAAEGHLDV